MRGGGGGSSACRARVRPCRDPCPNRVSAEIATPNIARRVRFPNAHCPCSNETREKTAMTEPRNASVAVVGAGDYIGAAIARRFAREGYAVFCGRRNGGQLAPLVAEIEAAGGQIGSAAGGERGGE